MWLVAAVALGFMLAASMLLTNPGKAKPQRPNVHRNIVERL
jgi:hypothetical protein